MPVTKVKISLNEMKRLIVEDIKKAEKDSVYGELLNNLKGLTDLTENYFKYDEKGNVPVLKEADYERLTKAYQNFTKSCDTFLNDGREKNSLEKKRVNMIKRLQSYAGKDLEQLLMADNKKESTLFDIVKDARTKTIDISNKKVAGVGGSLNSRIPLQTQNGMKGFFTQKKEYDPEKEYNSILEKNKDLLSPKSMQLLKGKDKDSKASNFLQMAKIISMNPEMNFSKEDAPDGAFHQVASALNTLDNSKRIAEYEEILKADLNYTKSVVKMMGELAGVLNMEYALGLADVPSGSRIDQRNVAMSNMAAFMGMGQVVAKSVSMKIIQDGEAVEGTFMENAKGEDIGRLNKDSLFLEADEASFRHGPALKQISDLAVLDYICGNTDRHSRNIMYQFEKQKEGNVILTGIVGIDNDNSFGTKTDFENERENGFITPLSKIKVISASGYAAIKNLRPEAVKLMLADKLSLEEINAVNERIHLLDQAIERKEVAIVPDQEWGKGDYTFEKLTTKAKGLFYEMKKTVKQLPTIKKDTLDGILLEGKVDFTKGLNVTDTGKNKFDEIYVKVNEFVSNTASLKGTFHKDSKEFKNMMTALKDVSLYGKAIQERLERGEEVDLETYRTFAEKTGILGVRSQEYLDAKKLTQATDLGKKRYDFAIQMRDMAQGHFPVLEVPKVEEPKITGPQEMMIR